jgi:tetratricopeptide (TPR) repeat protein
LIERSDFYRSPLEEHRRGDTRLCWQIEVVIVLLLATATLATYWPTLACDFVNLDDTKYVTENPVVASGLTLHGITYAWTTFDVGNWIPLTWLSFEFDASLFGLRARAFHATNLVMHAANVVLLYSVLRLMTSAKGRSAAVALLFAVHPLHVESVTWISERKDVLSTFWLLLTLLAYERYAREPARRRMILVLLLMGSGLLAKPMLVTLPILLLLIDHWPLQRVAAVVAGDDVRGIYPMRTHWDLIAEKVPLLGLSLADGIVTIIAQRSTEAMSGNDSHSLAIRAGNAIHGCTWYLWKTIYPASLCAFYPLSLAGTPWKIVWISALALTALSAYAAMQRRRRHLPFGWLWFVVALLPVSGIVQVGGQAHADRYAYVPHIGLFILIVWEVERWLPPGRVGRSVGIGFCGAVAVAFATMTWFQIGTWRNSETLWNHALTIDPDNYGAHLMLGSLRMQERKWDEAEKHLRRALVQCPNFDRAIYLLGTIHLQRGEWLLAEECLMWVLRKNPKNAEAARDLAALRPHLSVAKVARPERLTPAREAVDLNRRGLSNARRGEMRAALQCFRDALAIQPDFADAHNNAGLALNELQRFDEAKRQFMEAIEIEPDNADFQFNLASALVSQGDIIKALEHYKAALRLKPHDVETQIRVDKLQRTIESP